jgi:DNA-directed RNA polymerase specialized sigma24 family protein
MQDSRIPRRRLIKHAFAMTAELRTTLRRYTDNWADTYDLLQDLYVLLLDRDIGDPCAARASIRQLAHQIGAEWRGRKPSSPIHVDSRAVEAATAASEESPESLVDTEQRRALLRQVVSRFPERRKMPGNSSRARVFLARRPHVPCKPATALLRRTCEMH